MLRANFIYFFLVLHHSDDLSVFLVCLGGGMVPQRGNQAAETSAVGQREPAFEPLDQEVQRLVEPCLLAG